MSGFPRTVHAGTRWAACTLTGMFLISVTTSIGTTNAEGADPPLFVLSRLSVPVFVMLLYAGIEFKRAGESGLETLRAVRIGQLADSLYFIGFLWTLWALIDSFVIHQLSIAHAVFRAFGYALVTTMFGTFLRLLFIQFQNTDDIVEASHQRVEKEIESFAVTLAATTASVREFQTTTAATIEAWAEALNRATESLHTSASRASSQVAAEVQTLETSVTRLSGQLQSVAAAHGTLVSAIESAASAVQGSGDRLRDELGRSQTDLEALGEHVRTVNQTARAREEQVREVMTRGVERIGRVVDDAVETLARNTRVREKRLRQGQESVAFSSHHSGPSTVRSRTDAPPRPRIWRDRIVEWFR